MLEFYKHKYEENTKLVKHLSELENVRQDQNKKVKDLEKEIDDLKIKTKKYMEQYTTERNKNINQELEITKKNAEIVDLKNKKKLLDCTINDLELKINDQKRQIEDSFLEKEDSVQSLHSTEIILSQLDDPSGLDMLNFMNIDSIKKSKRHEKFTEDECEKELRQKDIDLLIEKCKAIQTEYEEYKLNAEGYIADLIKKAENLKQDLRILNAASSGLKPNSLLLSYDEDQFKLNAFLETPIKVVFLTMMNIEFKNFLYKLNTISYQNNETEQDFINQFRSQELIEISKVNTILTYILKS